MVHFLREKNSKSENNSEIYKFRSSLFESRALKKCYVEFVKFMKLNLFSEDDDKKVTENNITYLLNNEDKTASNIGSDVKGEIRIPCSINHKDEEYVITRICKNSFLYSQAEAILLPLDSEVRIIEKIHLNNQI